MLRQPPIAGTRANPGERSRITRWLLVALGLVLLLLLGLRQAPLFHPFAEALAVAIAGAAFAHAWRAYPSTHDDFLMFLAIVLFWSGALDLVHMLLYKGVTRLDIGQADPATQLWIGTRYLQAAGFMAAPCFLRRSLNRLNAFAVFAGIAGGLLACVLAGVFPLAYIAGPTPRTAFKLTSEYLVAGMFAASLAFLWLRRSRLNRGTLLLTGAAIAVLLVTELVFTLYIDLERVSNVVGHLLKVAGYLLLYRAIAGRRPAASPP
jgi:hypothetical protein